MAKISDRSIKEKIIRELIVSININNSEIKRLTNESRREKYAATQYGGMASKNLKNYAEMNLQEARDIELRTKWQKEMLSRYNH